MGAFFATPIRAFLLEWCPTIPLMNQSRGGSSSNPIQSMDVHSLQSSTSLNGNQQPGENKKKGRNNNHKGGKNNNKPKDNGNSEKLNNNVGEGKKYRWKVKFPYKLCTDNHLTHLCPNLQKLGGFYLYPPP
jgi:hypothetical protein